MKCTHFSMQLPVEGKWGGGWVGRVGRVRHDDGCKVQVWIVAYFFRNVECVDLMIGEGCAINAKDKLGR